MYCYQLELQFFSMGILGMRVMTTHQTLLRCVGLLSQHFPACQFARFSHSRSNSDNLAWEVHMSGTVLTHDPLLVSVNGVWLHAGYDH